MVDSNATISFICSAVHVTINHEIQIPTVINAQQLDIMFYSGVTKISIWFSAEIKDIYKFAGIRCISPQGTFLRKSSHTAIFIGKHRDIFVPDSKKQPIICDHCLLRIKYLICASLKIQQHNSGIRIAKPVKIRYIVILCTTVFVGCLYLIFQRNTCRRLIDLFNDRDAFLGYLRA